MKQKLAIVAVIIMLALAATLVISCGSEEESLGATTVPSWATTETQKRLRTWFPIKNQRQAMWSLVDDMDAAGGFWSLRGNASTTPGTDFLGTSDDQNVVVKRNSVVVGTFTTAGFDFLNSLVFENDETISNEVDGQVKIDGVLALANDETISNTVDGQLAFSGDLVPQAGFQIYPQDAVTTSARFDCSGVADYTVGTTQTICTLPANVNIVEITLVVTALFDDSGTDVLDCGIDGADPDEYVDNMDVSSAGVNRMGDGADMPVTNFGDVGAATVSVVCKYTGQNTNASAGAATLIVSYVVD